MRVLVADNHAASREQIAETLRRTGLEVTSVDDGLLAQEKLMEGAHQIALLDWRMPGIEGPALCRALRATDVGRYLYLILVTDPGDPNDIVVGLGSGADEYVLKPCRMEELLARVRAGERIINLQQQLREANEKLGRLAMLDDLTGLPNRRSVLERLEQELARSRRDEQPLSIALTDLDQFKQINDTLGHPAGDRALREFAARLSSGTRRYDVVARFGGDEFLVLLPMTPLAQAAATTIRLCTSIGAQPFELVDGEQHFRTASFGVTEAELASDTTELLARADEALYQAKSQGGNQVCTRRPGPR